MSAARQSEAGCAECAGSLQVLGRSDKDEGAPKAADFVGCRSYLTQRVKSHPVPHNVVQKFIDDVMEGTKLDPDGVSGPVQQMLVLCSVLLAWCLTDIADDCRRQVAFKFMNMVAFSDAALNASALCMAYMPSFAKHTRFGSAGAKKRAAPAAPAISDADVVQHTKWNDLVAQGTLRSKTNDVLKAYCRHFKLPATGKKADLVDRVAAHVQSS